jgi:hypothetical protein
VLGRCVDISVKCRIARVCMQDENLERIKGDKYYVVDVL